MQKNLFKLSALLIVFIMSCANQGDGLVTIDKISQFESNVSPLIFVSSNEFLDLPYSKSQITDPNTKFSDVEKAKMKASLYRFYSHLELEDGLYKSSLKNGKEIEISESIFELLANNIKEVNRAIEGQKGKGSEYEVPPITQEYLETLLK